MSPLHPSLHCPDNPAEEIERVGVEEEPQRNKTLHIKKTDTHMNSQKLRQSAQNLHGSISERVLVLKEVDISLHS